MTDQINVNPIPKKTESTDSRKKRGWKGFMHDYFWILLIVAWFVLMKFILPSFGVPT
jgi:hypothetical protein